MLLPTAVPPRCKAASRSGRGSPTQTTWTTCTATSHQVGCNWVSICLVYQGHLHIIAHCRSSNCVGMCDWQSSHRHPNPFNAFLRTAPPCAAPAGSDLRCYNNIQNEAYGASERPGWRHYQSPVAEIKPLQAASIAYTFPAEQVGMVEGSAAVAISGATGCRRAGCYRAVCRWVCTRTAPRGTLCPTSALPALRRTICSCSAAGHWRLRRCGPHSCRRVAAQPRTLPHCTASTAAVRPVVFAATPVL